MQVQAEFDPGTKPCGCSSGTPFLCSDSFRVGFVLRQVFFKKYPKYDLRCPEATSLQPEIRDKRSLLTPASLSKSCEVPDWLSWVMCPRLSQSACRGGGRRWTLATGVRDRLYCRGQVGLDVVVHRPPQASGAGEGVSRGKSKKLGRC